MTVTDRPQQTETPETDRLKGRNRVLTITVVVLAVALLALGAWVIYDLTAESDTAPSAEIEQVIDDYLTALGATAAREAHDPAAFRAVVTDDFAATEMIHRQFGDQLAVIEEDFTLDTFIMASGWQAELVGEPVVTGEGPWFASMVENWSDADEQYPGTATYVIVDEGGTLKVAGWYWVGQSTRTG